VSVIITHNRPGPLATLLTGLRGQDDAVVVIDNASTPPLDDAFVLQNAGSDTVAVLHDDEQPPNLYRLWNLGFDVARSLCDGNATYDIAVFNDDAVVPAGWFDAVSDALRSGSYAAASSDPYGRLTASLVKTEPDGDLMTRLCPWAFVMRGELELRANETFRWWWGDTDFDWHCRQSGGIIVTPGYVVHNSLANSTTVGALAEQAGRDRETFRVKWGHNPW